MLAILQTAASSQVSISGEAIALIAGALVVAQLALRVVGGVIESKMGVMKAAVDLSPVVDAIDTGLDGLREQIADDAKATVALLQGIHNGTTKTVEILAEKDSRGLPRVYCSSPETLEKATSGPFREIKDEIRKVGEDVRRRT